MVDNEQRRGCRALVERLTFSPVMQASRARTLLILREVFRDTYISLFPTSTMSLGDHVSGYYVELKQRIDVNCAQRHAPRVPSLKRTHDAMYEDVGEMLLILAL